ncbi:MAG: RNA-binding protein [Candidatus Krumholzibacteria bacterium]|nr:RNA-binding protein [Candidatus Krumholzibacteria bacterium]
MKIYVGNMSYDTSEDDLRTAFEAHGTVDSVAIISDRDTGRPKGFGFVEMSNDDEAKAAIEALNEKDLMGRTLKVNEARPRNDNRGGGGRGGGGGGRGGGGWGSY